LKWKCEDQEDELQAVGDPRLRRLLRREGEQWLNVQSVEPEQHGENTRHDDWPPGTPIKAGEPCSGEENGVDDEDDASG
jgi:hypothetical protein